MKHIKSYLALLSLVLVVASACDRVDEDDYNFKNALYIEQAKTTITSRNAVTEDQTQQVIQVALAQPEGVDIRVKLRVDQTLLPNYGIDTQTNVEAMPADNYYLSATEVTIPAGSVLSDDLTIYFRDLESLERNTNYTVALTIDSNSENMKVQGGASTIFYIYRKGAIVTTAPDMTENWIEVPGYPSFSEVMALEAVTMEWLMRPTDDFLRISTVMGVEDYWLLRFGDSAADNQIQLALDAFSEPHMNGPDFAMNVWTHCAMVWDPSNGNLLWYVNGNLHSSSVTGYNFSAGAKSINLAYGRNGGRQFIIGNSYDNKRWFNGNYCEMRVWNVARTQEEIAENIYIVDPQSEGLISYWKMNEGSGDAIRDYTTYGNDGRAANPLKWATDVELPIEEE